MSDKSKFNVYEANLSEFKPDPKNHNKHTLKGHKMVTNSMQNRGYARPGFAANDGTVLGGNLSTMEIAPSLGIGDGRVIVVETDGTIPIIHKRTDVAPDSLEAKQLSYEDNLSGVFSFELDPSVVMADIEAGFDFEAIDISLPDLGELLDKSTAALLAGETAGKDTEPQIDKAEELRVKWGVESGQLWQLGEHRIICGDCTDAATVARVMGGERAEYGIQDPPYGISVVGGSKPFGSVGGSNIVRANNYHPIVDDNKPYNPSYILSICSKQILWGANYYADKLPPKKGWIVWDKKGKEWDDNFSDCELAWTPFDTVTKIYRHLWMGIVQEGKREQRQHPTQKPSELYEKLISAYFTGDGIIIDFYLGSGTTIIACENLSRRCRAIEIDPGYVAVALQRWADHTGKTPVLIG